MNTLDIKHVAPYLPYGLNFLTHKHRIKYGQKTVVQSRGMSLDDDGTLVVEFLYEDDLIFSNEMKSCQPLLYPLSYLSKEIEHNGEIVEPYELLAYTERLQLVRADFNPLSMLSYATVQKLIEFRFDVFGLIDQGLAIDVTTLTNNPYTK